jgi:uncharacterized cupin superfamily protein
MAKSIVIATPATFELGTQTQPITPSWVLTGSPVSRTKSVARSYDWTENIVVWDCTAGRFQWHYSQDETAVVISGEAFILNEQGEERRLGPGDVVFFPAGTSCTWRVPDSIRKIAVVRETLWRPLGFGLKAWKKLLRMTGIAGEAPL